ncbi:hypothetical protein CDD81_2092 [Ophiocordyceps australis]|uniref:Calcium uniporter protein n=1 Tax=Ophiocordyceps australis TaxID=1399860 RepID=A0A2C5XZI0_9HYPO|nr:hypothetical protein CDD81_2092 [Ophiocordyceps australis]
MRHVLLPTIARLPVLSAGRASSRSLLVSRATTTSLFRSLSNDVNDANGRSTTTKSAQRKANDRPWMRESSNALPEATSHDPSGGDASKGRLLTTPTRLLKLILPMPFNPQQEHINASESEKKRWTKTQVEPLALLVHPQQPLSYLERLIQAEIPPLKDNGRERLPEIVFRAEASGQTSNQVSPTPSKGSNVASYSGLGREGPSNSEAHWVRWSSSTEVGDFIRDAARGREFAINIEGHEPELRVAVPSFGDRTYYMRMRLRRMSRQIDQMSHLKKECDELAHKGAHRLAKGGFAALAGWWAVVYYVTFHTDFGWDLVEPITYLAGLGGIMAGYLWFLFISRDLSYKAAMNLTVSRRQNALYQERGFNPQRWEQLVHEANQLRREIRIAASEYDVDWDEMKDLNSEDVKEALAQDRKNKKSTSRNDEEEDDSDKDSDNDKGDEPGKKETKASTSSKD